MGQTLSEPVITKVSYNNGYSYSSNQFRSNEIIHPNLLVILLSYSLPRNPFLRSPHLLQPPYKSTSLLFTIPLSLFPPLGSPSPLSQHTSSGEDESLVYGISEMQGWRISEFGLFILFSRRLPTW